MIAFLACLGFGAIVAVVTIVAERHRERRILRATPSHGRRAERAPAAISAGPFVITDLPGAHQGARDSERK